MAAVARNCVAPATPTPEVAVVIVWLDHPLVPIKVNAPTAPLLTMVIVKLGSLVFVNVQVIVWPETLAILAAGTVNTFPERFAVMLALA